MRECIIGNLKKFKSVEFGTLGPPPAFSFLFPRVNNTLLYGGELTMKTWEELQMDHNKLMIDQIDRITDAIKCVSALLENQKKEIEILNTRIYALETLLKEEP